LFIVIKNKKHIYNKLIFGLAFVTMSYLTVSAFALNKALPERQISETAKQSSNTSTDNNGTAKKNQQTPNVETTAAQPTRPASNVSQTTATSAPSSSPLSTTFQMNEQFSGNNLNSSWWQAMTYPKGYRNNEEQDYSPSQVALNNGNLEITAVKDGSGNWHSGEVNSKWAYTYGDFEVRLALSATGQGVWPAAWLLGNGDPWPSNGEIDIFENINGESTSYGTIHGGGSNGEWWLQHYCYQIDQTQFHTYRLSKRPNYISWWVDGNLCGEWRPSQMPAGAVWPFETHTNIGILNLAIGGNWPGPSNSSTPDSITMYVDYFTVKNAY
jgi:beta-glucanase (GH16 family)